MNVKHALAGAVFASIVISLALVAGDWNVLGYPQVSRNYMPQYVETIATPPTIGPVSYDKIGGRIITKYELAEFLEKNDMKLCLPTWIPSNLSLTAVWALVQGDDIRFPIVFVYSPDGDTYYRTSQNKLIIAIKGFSAEVGKLRESALGMNTKGLFEYYVNRGAIPIYDRVGELVGVIIPGGRKSISHAIVEVNGLEYHLYYKDPNALKAIIESMCAEGPE